MDARPDKAIDDEVLRRELMDVSKRLRVIVTQLRDVGVTPMLLTEVEGAHRRVEAAISEATQLYDW